MDEYVRIGGLACIFLIFSVPFMPFLGEFVGGIKDFILEILGKNEVEIDHDENEYDSGATIKKKD